MEFINNYKKINNEFIHNQINNIEYGIDTSHLLKIDSKDRNINSFPNPYEFKVRFNSSDNREDEYGNVGPIIYNDFDNIKNFDIVHISIPRYSLKCNKNNLTKKLI